MNLAIKKSADAALKKILGQFKRALVQLKAPSILLAESDGFVLRAVVIHAESGKARASAWAESRAGDPSIAVGEVCAQLNEALGGLPKKGYMIAPGLVSALLELPVEPDKLRSAAQMQELIRWEIDPFVSEFDELWNIGAILQGSGHLSAEQRHEIATELEVRLTEGDRSLQRFGELALARQFINREQLENCLAIQEKLVSRDVNLSCGWALQKWGDEEDLQYTWLVGAIADLRRKHWFSSFSRAGVRLQQFHSGFGAVIPLLSAQDDSKGERLLLELHQEQIACLRIVDDKTIVSLQIIARPLDAEALNATCLTLCSEQMRTGIDVVWLHSALPLPVTLIPGLAEGLGREVKILTTPDLDPAELPLPVSECLSLYGLSQNLLQLNKRYQPLAIPAADPPPAIWKNIELWRYALPVIFCLGLAGHLIWSELHLLGVGREQIQVEAERSQKSKLNAAVSRLSGDAARYDSELKKTQERLRVVNKKLSLIDGVLVRRQTQLPDFLRELANVINPYVVVEELLESASPPGFQLVIWAVHDASAQQYAKELESNMATLGYMVADIELKVAKGRTGVKGYGVNIWLIPFAEPADKALKTSASARKP